MTEKGYKNGYSLTFVEFSWANRLRSESPNGFNHALGSWSLSDWLTAVMGELGEAANVAKKLNRVRNGIPGNDETEAELRAAFRREIADTFIYLDLLAQSQGFRLDDAAREVFDAKSKEIGCPIVFGEPRPGCHPDQNFSYQKLLHAAVYTLDVLRQNIDGETVASRIGLIGGYHAEKLLADAITSAAGDQRRQAGPKPGG